MLIKVSLNLHCKALCSDLVSKLFWCGILQLILAYFQSCNLTNFNLSDNNVNNFVFWIFKYEYLCTLDKDPAGGELVHFHLVLTLKCWAFQMGISYSTGSGHPSPHFHFSINLNVELGGRRGGWRDNEIVHLVNSSNSTVITSTCAFFVPRF